ncbi:hypothetical protein [Mesorhizobium sp.]|uniref:hypothetical protein n=1 Tax=Mesorhizobium sp. TaxID=1871066 RepID=UPI000FE81BC8|nr:hypothetical protein [Mesorhizobium sp.]RWM07954.1 MAG: hypothetical protein EOR71_14440 [Mesorhizobium sp.]
MKGNPDRQNVVSFADYAPSRFLAAYLRNEGVIVSIVDELNESVTANSAQGAWLLKSLLNSGACLQSIIVGGEVRDGD